jgi:hypothetical protein
VTEHWMCGSCRSLNDAAARRCYKCRTPRTSGELVDASGRAGAPGLAAQPPREASLIGGIFGGLTLGVIATALWIWANFNIPESRFAGRGFVNVSWFVGAGVALGVVFGGRGRTSFALVLFSFLLTLVCLVIGEYLVISQVLAEEAGLDVTPIAMAQPQDVIDFLPRIIPEAPLRPVLWVVALATAWLVPWTRLAGTVPNRRRDDR